MTIFSPFICSTLFLHIFGEEYAVSNLPRGYCSYCCPADFYSNVKLFLYTSENGENGIELSWTDWDINKNILKKNQKIRFYIHGFTETRNSGPSKALINALLSTGCVIVVDWGHLATLPWYNQAVENSQIVGKAVANWLNAMCSTGLNINIVHIIAFSLGVEIAGYVGHYFTAGKIPRITGLDPAHGARTDSSIGRRISVEDATFIDIIHTDSGPLGYLAPQGHVDFFPNLGIAPQPGCTMQEIISHNRLWELFACSHNRAWRYFVESIEKPDSFPAVAMGNVKNQVPVAYMGMPVNSRCRGMYYLETRGIGPYGKGQDYLHKMATILINKGKSVVSTGSLFK